MFRYLHVLLVLSLLLLCVAVEGLEMPERPSGRVNDFARVLTQSEIAQLEERLRLFEQETSNQLVIAVFPELGDEDVDDFTNRLFEKWRLGQRDRNNGVLIAVFIGDRKVRIEVGYGLEGALTDATSNSIIQNEIAPEFRQGRYAAGLNSAVTAIEQATRGEYKGRPSAQQPSASDSYSALLFFLFILFLLYISRRRQRRGIFLPGSGYHRGCGFPIIFFPGGGGRGGGGGWGSGGGGGGGFSGGGGLSGGGGASGSW